MRFKVIACMLAVALLSAVAYGGDDNEKKREKSRKMAAQTMQDLYKLQPTVQAAVEKSAGYAVFNNMGTNLLLLSTARGSGIAVNTQGKQETFMKMISAGPNAIPRLRLVSFSADGRRRQGRQVGRSLLGSG
jgi:type II secretory pathway pseudopilin PulG